VRSAAARKHVRYGSRPWRRARIRRPRPGFPSSERAGSRWTLNDGRAARGLPPLDVQLTPLGSPQTKPPLSLRTLSFTFCGDLDQRQEIELRVQHKDYVMRTEAKGTAGRVFQACGVALPPTLRTGPEPLQPG
jgi:hypothetical protein